MVSDPIDRAHQPPGSVDIQGKSTGARKYVNKALEEFLAYALLCTNLHGVLGPGRRTKSPRHRLGLFYLETGRGLEPPTCHLITCTVF